MLYDWPWGQLSQLAKFRGPISIYAGWGMLGLEIGSQCGICPVFLEKLIFGPRVRRLECRRGRHKSRGSEGRSLSCGSSIEPLANELDVSFTSLTCGCPWKIMELVPEVSLLRTAKETPPTHP